LNKKDGNVRGNLGTEVINKAESTIKVEKDEREPSISVVSSEFSRAQDFEPFAISINENDIPYIREDYILSSKGDTSKMPHNYEVHVQLQIAKDAFNGEAKKYTDSWRAIKQVCSKHGIKIGDSKSKDWLAHFKMEGMINYCIESKYYRFNDQFKPQ